MGHSLMPAHYLQPLQKTVLPARHVIFDTETQLTRHAGALEHRYRTGAAGELLPDRAGGWDWNLPPETLETPKQLWENIAGYCRKGHRTVAWAHNISFDLRVSEALRWLPRQGFKLQGIVLERTASWASWTSKEHGSLICCDLYAWLPRSLDDIARELGVSRETWDTERYQTATLPELQARCIADVQVTRQAVQALLTWLAEEDCGPFRLTGSGQAHACWRKRFNAGKDAGRGLMTNAGGVWIHGDPELRQLEREAMWTGRCEAWAHGPIDGPLYEYDMNLAYCRIAAQHLLPVRLRGEHGSLSHRQLRELIDDPALAVMAEVEITDLGQPMVPCRVGERMIWPVGNFNTILWDPELELLGEMDYLVKRCWTYQTGLALQPMAQWIIEGLESTSTPPPIRLLLKHWARALIGRMALRYRRWEDYGTMPDLGLALWVGYDEDGLPTENLQVGHDRFQLAELTETETSAPQITGWVMSQCRAQLWHLIQACEYDGKHVLYMDTDSLLLDGKLPDGPSDPVLELKATWSHAEIHGPRNLELDTERRLAGVPRTAKRTGPLEYEGTVMRGIKESIIRSELDHVAQLNRPYHVSSVDPRRERYPDGSTQPYRLGGDDAGE
jgi:hypothetical protein